MFKKYILWLSNYNTMMLLSICSFLFILSNVIITQLFGDFEENGFLFILLIGSLLWIRLESINASKIDYNDIITRTEKLYYDQCRFERAICEKFDVVYRQDEDGLETFYDKKEYYDKEYQKSKKELEGNNQ